MEIYMFSAVYKTTMKNLFRSPLFWLMLIFVYAVGIRRAVVGFTAQFNFSLGEMIYDNDPRYLIDSGAYLKFAMNSVITDILKYAIPAFAVVTVTLILNRDYGDNLYEIEKAAGLSPISYVIGRLSAICTVCLAVTTTSIFISFQYFTISRGSLIVREPLEYITESTVRIMRNIVLIAWPCVLFYIGLAYFIGCLFRSGFASSVVTLIYMMIFVASESVFMMRAPALYLNYISPVPKKIVFYLWYYGTSVFESAIESQGTSAADAAVCVIFLVGAFTVLSLLAFICTKKRDK